MNLNWYTVLDAGQQATNELRTEAEHYRLAKQVKQQPVRWSLPRLRLSQPKTASRPFRRVLS